MLNKRLLKFTYYIVPIEEVINSPAKWKTSKIQSLLNDNLTKLFNLKQSNARFTNGHIVQSIHRHSNKHIQFINNNSFKLPKQEYIQDK